MDDTLYFTEQHLQVREMVRSFAQQEVAPVAAKFDANSEFPWDNVKKMAELGLMGIPWSEELGGAGLDTLSYVIVLHELAKVDCSHAASASPSAWAAIPIRPESRVIMKFVNPSPSLPSRFSAGTSTSSRISSRVSDERQPSLSSFFPERKPGIGLSESSWPTPRAFVRSRSQVSFVRIKELMPFDPAPGWVTAVTTATSATPPCVMKILEPFSK